MAGKGKKQNRKNRSKHTKRSPLVNKSKRKEIKANKKLINADNVTLKHAARLVPAITENDLKKDIDAGFKPESNGKISLWKYAAWLLQQHGYKDRDEKAT